MRGRGDRRAGRPGRQEDGASAGIDFQSQDRGDQGTRDQIPAHQTGESQVHAAQLVQNAPDVIQEQH